MKEIKTDCNSVRSLFNQLDPYSQVNINAVLQLTVSLLQCVQTAQELRMKQEEMKENI